MKKAILSVKSFLSLGLVLILVLGVLLNPMEAEAAKKKKGGTGYAEGDDIAFGFFDGTILSWTILTYDDTTKTAFVVSRKPLSSRSVTAYRAAIAQLYRQNGTNAGYVRWSENYWRGWLNQTFYNDCFNDTEKAMIQKTVLTEKSAQDSLMNFYHDTTMDANVVKGAVKNSLNMAIYNSQTTTTDKIFFLSSDEYTQYKDVMKNETLCMFPLRTNAYDDPTQGLFGNDTDKLIYRMYYYSGDSIRPAMYVKLGEADATTTDSSSTDSKTTTAETSSTTKNSTTTATATATSTTASSTTTSSTTTSNTTSNNSSSSSEKKTSSKKYANNGTNNGAITLPDDSFYSMTIGATAQVAIDLEYLNSTEKNYTIYYTSSDANVFTVDSNGLITATGKGSASVTAKMKKSNGKVYTMSCRVDVQ